MVKEKRKHSNDWIETTILHGEGLRGSYLASFSGIIPPDAVTFREYKRKRPEDRPIKDVILQGETERIEFEGRTRRPDNVDECR